MHILFVHQNYPAQFGHVAARLAHGGHRCTFVSTSAEGPGGGVERLRYRPLGGATARTHYCTRTFENAVAHAHGVYEALKTRPDVRPDLVVGHSGFGSTLFLKELYPRVPVVNYFEYYYHPTGTDLDFRPDFPASELTRLRSYARNAMIQLDLENCDRGYSPTRWQRSLVPAAYRGKIDVVFDGVDTAVWRPLPRSPRRVGGLTIPDGVKVVTYATRGMEAMRGFDVFMRMARLLCDRRRDVVFLIAGQDRVCYGGDEAVTGGRSFKEWVLLQGDYDRSRFHFLGLLPPAELARLFAVSDLHVYLTVPFVLSWSLLNALACGATVLASDTAPVREVVTHGVTGLLADFFDTEGMADAAEKVLAAPDEYRRLGEAGVGLVRESYSLDVCLPRLEELLARASGFATVA
jgi:glycosyltransferase involved in cell wall biosynthesis